MSYGSNKVINFFWFRQILQKHKIPSLTDLHNLLWFLKRNKVTPAQALLKRYRDPLNTGSLGGVERFADVEISNKRAQNLLRKDLAYTLHRPRRRKGISHLTHSSDESR